MTPRPRSSRLGLKDMKILSERCTYGTGACSDDADGVRKQFVASLAHDLAGVAWQLARSPSARLGPLSPLRGGRDSSGAQPRR